MVNSVKQLKFSQIFLLQRGCPYVLGLHSRHIFTTGGSAIGAEVCILQSWALNIVSEHQRLN